jgi:hypothetical protein
VRCDVELRGWSIAAAGVAHRLTWCGIQKLCTSSGESEAGIAERV